MKSRLLAIAAFAALALVVPSTASAATTCNFAGGVVDLDTSNGTVQVVVKRNGNNIEITDVFDGGNVVCAGGTPTVTTTNTISFDESATTAQGTSFVVDLSGGALAPGIVNEAGSSDEIELTVATDNDGEDRIFVAGSSGDDVVRMGATGANQGVNLNGAESDGIDVDVDAVDLEGAGSDAAAGNDTITADGSGAGLGFTGPLNFDTTFNGQADDDTLASGTGGNNRLDGEGGNDTLTGIAGGDSLNPGFGNDTVAGGGGSSDLVSYLNHNQGVNVDLRQTSPQNTVGAGTDTISGVEGAIGSNATDTLIGNDDPAIADILVGGQLGADTGNDTLIGKAGNDSLRGAPGNDTLIGGAGADAFNGAEGTDTVSYAQDSQGAIAFSLAQANTGNPQSTGAAGNDTLIDNDTLFGAGDGIHEIENLTGSASGDTLGGDNNSNEIVGGDGQDSLSLAGGSDQFDVYDGGQDTVDCGGQADSGTADEQGVDALTACEATDFAPQVAVADGPANGGLTNDATPTYSLTADEGATFQLEVDNGGFANCAAACEVPALSDGQHTLRFRAKDADEALNVGLNAVTRTVTVDTGAPQVQVNGPDATADTTPTFEFSASEGAGFECKVDGGGFAPCSGPGETHTTGPLADGAHTIEVRATDAAGNQGSASRAFTVDGPDPQDTDAPETTVKKPKVKGDDVTLKFASDEQGSSFRCKLDKGKFKSCTSPKRYKNLDDGKHKVLVAATDAAGNVDPSAAKAKFEIG